MPNRRLISNINIDKQDLNVENWPLVSTLNLSEENQKIYMSRKDAVIMYLKNEKTIKEICQITNIGEKNLRRIVKRCFEFDSKGFIWGYRALIPKKHIKKYERTKEELDSQEHGFSGIFELLLYKYPVLREKIFNWYFNKTDEYVTDNVVQLRYIHKRFLNFCKSVGVEPTEYPFNTSSLGKMALYRYLENLKNDNFYYEAQRHGEDAARRARSTGLGTQNYKLTIRPFERVQFDGHKIDGIFTITFKTLEGDIRTEVLERIWILVIIDVATRTILSHYLCLNKEYSASDVLHCIRNAIVPKNLIDLKIPCLKYPENGGFPSVAIPETQWALWEEFSYDNGKANLANIVRNRLTKIVGCGVNPGPVKMPERRVIIERFFGILEENGYHRLPNTTGSNSRDVRRKNPEEQARRFNISYEDINELTEILIANYNNTPNENNHGASPLECLKERINRGMIPRKMDLEKRNEIDLLTLCDQRPVKGNPKRGKRPYINFEGVEYRSDLLSNNSGLIGVKLDLLINIDDIRSIRAFLPDGSELGYLSASGKWGIIPHSLQIRKKINKLRQNKLIYFTNNDDPIEAYNNYLLEGAKKNKNSRNQLVILNEAISREQGNTESGYSNSNVNQEIFEDKNIQNHKKDSSRKVSKTIIY